MSRSCPVSGFEKLLLTADGSEHSEGAVREGIRIADLGSGKLHVLAVVETNPEYETIAPGLIEKADEAAWNNLEAVRTAAEKAGVKCELISRHAEEPYEAIVDEARKKGIEMIVMGRRGRTGLKRLLMGSVTAKVIGHSPCSILVVPKDAIVDFKNILVATDGSQYSDSSLRAAVDMAKTCGASLTVVSVVPSEASSPFDIVHSEMQRDMISKQESEAAEKHVKDAVEAAKKEGVSVSGLVVGGRAYEAIIETAEEKKADLIVMGSHGRTGLDRLLMGSVTERVVGHAGCAVLVVKKK